MIHPRRLPSLIRSLARFGVACLLLSLLAQPSVEAASIPNTINYQGRLTDNSPQQNPLDASLPMEFRIYGSPMGADLLWDESWPSVAVVQGIFSVLLGGNGNPIPPDLFAGGADRYLEVVVDGEVLMPRQQIGAVAYANQAERLEGLSKDDLMALSLPTGAVQFFDLPACPTGWSELTAARGRGIVGMPLNGTLGGVVGTPLTDRQARSHSPLDRRTRFLDQLCSGPRSRRRPAEHGRHGRTRPSAPGRPRLRCLGPGRHPPAYGRDPDQRDGFRRIPRPHRQPGRGQQLDGRESRTRLRPGSDVDQHGRVAHPPAEPPGGRHHEQRRAQPSDSAVLRIGHAPVEALQLRRKSCERDQLPGQRRSEHHLSRRGDDRARRVDQQWYG